MAGDPIRRSGEIRVEQSLGELLTQIHGSVEKRLDDIVDRFEKHADRVDTRLAAGDTKMALLNQSINKVEESITGLRTDIKDQSDRIHDIEIKKPIGDRTPRATPALMETKKEAPEPWVYRAFRKGAEYSIAAVMAAIALALVLWIIRGNAAKIVDTAPASTPSTAPSSTTPATGTP